MPGSRANKTMHKTKPARRSFSIIARRKRLGGGVGSLLPLRARDLLVIVGVSASVARQPLQPS